MIKIVLDRSIFEYDGRGIAKVTNALYRELFRRYSDKFELYCLCHKPLVTPVNFPYHEIRYDGTWEDAWSFGFAEAVASMGVDFVHFPFNANFSRRWRDVLPPRTKIISTIHDMIPFALPDMHHVTYEWLAMRREHVRYFADASAIILTDSYCSKADLNKYAEVDENKVEVLYYAGFLKDVAPEGNIPDGEYFLFNGGYDYRKGIEQMLDCFLQLKMRGLLRSKLVMTGARHNLSLKLSALLDYGIDQGWIVDMGYVTDANLVALFKHARALIYLSAYEGFGLPPLEAMSLGCPVVTCENSSIVEVCGDAVCYVNRDDDNEVCTALMRLERDDEYRKQFSELGIKKSLRFSWEKTATQFFNLLCKLKGN